MLFPSRQTETDKTFYLLYGKFGESKVNFFVQCTKMQLITLQNVNIQTYFSQLLWFFNLEYWFKGQITSRIHLSLSNAYKLMCFDRNINGNKNVKFLECDYLLVQRCVKVTLESRCYTGISLRDVFPILICCSK